MPRRSSQFALAAALASFGCTTASTAGSTSGSSGGGTSAGLTTTGGNGSTALPLGDEKISTVPQVGYIDSCQTSFGSGGRASAVGPWVDVDAGFFDFGAKIVVEGSVASPNATFSVAVDAGTTWVSGNGLPDHATGTFPIAASDPAHQYDQNPNHIGAQSLLFSLPASPTVAASPTCLSGGPIGVLFTGAYLYDGLDAEGRDALAHEIQDSSGEPCAGSCVPNCNLSGSCPNNLTCNPSLGICLP